VNDVNEAANIVRQKALQNGIDPATLGAALQGSGLKDPGELVAENARKTGGELQTVQHEIAEIKRSLFGGGVFHPNAPRGWSPAGSVRADSGKYPEIRFPVMQFSASDPTGTEVSVTLDSQQQSRLDGQKAFAIYAAVASGLANDEGKIVLTLENNGDEVSFFNEIPLLNLARQANGEFRRYPLYDGDEFGYQVQTNSTISVTGRVVGAALDTATPKDIFLFINAGGSIRR